MDKTADTAVVMRPDSSVRESTQPAVSQPCRPFQFDIDAWEPSLLERMLRASGRRVQSED